MSATPARSLGIERFRETFPYDALPRVQFEPQGVPMAPAQERWITDTTFRDGQQARPPYTAEEALHIYDLLHQLDNNTGVVRKSEFFIYTELERNIVERCRSRGYTYPEVTAWIRAKEEDLAIVRELGLAETGMLTSVSDHHIFTKLGLDHDRAMEAYLRVVDAALNAGVRPRCHFEDVTRADMHRFVVPFARALMELGRDAGTAITIRLCDTMGVGLPWAEAALPRGVPRLVHTLINEAGVPPEQLEWHGHNDFFKGHACAATAWLYGCAAINSTLLGTGERAGNTPLEAAIVEYIGLTGETNLNLRTLVEIADYLHSECGVPLPSNYPILGDECFTTRAGVHIDGLLKDPETYMSFDPQRVLGRPIRVVVSDKSGAAGVTWWVNDYYHLAGEGRLTKSHPAIQAMYRDLMASYEAGRTADPSAVELRELVGRHLPWLAATPA
jgi:isopropylmalate/homocitrate/citramalate synthase